MAMFDTGQDAKRPFDRGKSLRPRAPGALVRVEEQWLGGSLPTLIRPVSAGVSLARWVEDNREQVLDLLDRTCGILFRGFAVSGEADFAQAALAVAPDPLPYTERSSPRSQVGGTVYTSTDHPADQPIFLHNEQSYTLSWPLRIMFFCDVEPEEGGRTPIADNRRVLAGLPGTVLDAFERRGVLYVRNYAPNVGLSWQTAFQTEDRAEVEAFCRARRIGFEWRDGDRLRTWQRRSAFQTHPRTGERLWFNHAMFFNATSVIPAVRDALLKVMGPEDFPYHTYYGDGTPIEPATLEAIRAAVDAATVRFDWRKGDVLVLDNMLAQHGREPYTGRRRILTVMASPCEIPAPDDMPEPPASGRDAR
jgi:alpha-ketoglutarate-dependent taurine dioxygenase